MSGFPEVKSDEYLKHLVDSFPRQKILVAGSLAETALKVKHPNIFPLRSSDDLKSFL